MVFFNTSCLLFRFILFFFLYSPGETNKWQGQIGHTPSTPCILRINHFNFFIASPPLYRYFSLFHSHFNQQSYFIIFSNFLYLFLFLSLLDGSIYIYVLLYKYIYSFQPLCYFFVAPIRPLHV